MKKLILAVLSLFTIMSLIGCGNKHSFISLVSGSNGVTNTNTQQVQQIPEQEVNQEPQISNDSLTQNNQQINIDEYEIFEDIDYFEYEYTTENGVFTITAFKNKTNKDDDIITPITQARGRISGLSRTYFIELPYTTNWQTGDKLDIIYRKAYNKDTEETIIADILYISPLFKDMFAPKEEILSTPSEIEEIEEVEE